MAKIQYSKGKNSGIGQRHNSPIGILPQNTYFSFQSQLYEQVEGAGMGPQVSPIVANLYMEYFEQKALTTHPTPDYGSGMWMTHLSSKRKITNKHINCIVTRFTVEDNKEDGAIPSLDTTVKPETGGGLSTHTNIYSGIVTIIFQPSTV